MVEKIKKFIGNRNNLVALILVGVLLMVIAIPTGGKKQGGTEGGSDPGADTARDAAEEDLQAGRSEAGGDEAYVSRMEERLEEVLSLMEGAGRVRVIITLRASEERIVEKDQPVSRSNTAETDSDGGTRTVNTIDSDEDTVFSTDGSISIPYVIKTLSPQVEGVLVMAEGAGRGDVSRNLSEAVQVLFGIEAHRIKIVRMSGIK